MDAVIKQRGNQASFEWPRSKTRSSRKTRKLRRISFRGFQLRVFHFAQNEKLGDENLGVLFQAFTKLRVLPIPSFPFCTVLKTENLEMKTSECSFKPFYQTPSFPFCAIPKTENSELETSQFSLRFTRTAIYLIT